MSIDEHERLPSSTAAPSASSAAATRHLVSHWIPALDGVDERLRAGGLVADVGCGHGASAILIAQAYPRTRVVGFDYHDASIAEARRRAAATGVADRVRFEIAAADAFPGRDYDLVACFDSLHDMGDPVAAAHHVHAALAPDGTWLIVEPRAGVLHIVKNYTGDIGPGEIEIGVGIHGEPGRRRDRMRPAGEIVDEIAHALLADLAAPDGAQLLAFVTGLGGTPLIEQQLVFAELADRLYEAGLSLSRSLLGPYLTALDMAGVVVTLPELDDELERLWDAPVVTPGLRWGG